MFGRWVLFTALADLVEKLNPHVDLFGVQVCVGMAGAVYQHADRRGAAGGAPVETVSLDSGR